MELGLENGFNNLICPMYMRHDLYRKFSSKINGAKNLNNYKIISKAEAQFLVFCTIVKKGMNKKKTFFVMFKGF